MVLRPLVAGALAQIQTKDWLPCTVSIKCVNLKLLKQIETTLDICLENTFNLPKSFILSLYRVVLLFDLC